MSKMQRGSILQGANETGNSMMKDAAGGKSRPSYGIPTIKLLNPELYKEMEKQDR